jgi:hypothetical protein
MSDLGSSSAFAESGAWTYDPVANSRSGAMISEGLARLGSLRDVVIWRTRLVPTTNVNAHRLTAVGFLIAAAALIRIPA